MRNVLSAGVFLFALLLVACGSAAPSGDDASLEDRDLKARLARPTTAPVVQRPALPAPGANGDASISLPGTMVVAGVADAPSVLDLVENLRLRGIAIKPSGESRVEFLADVPGQSYQVGAGWLHVHHFPDSGAASSTQAAVRQGLNNPVASWPAPPHAFQCGQLIAVYFGIDEQITEALNELCGPQFAGSK